MLQSNQIMKAHRTYDFFSASNTDNLVIPQSLWQWVENNRPQQHFVHLQRIIFNSLFGTFIENIIQKTLPTQANHDSGRVT